MYTALYYTGKYNSWSFKKYIKKIQSDLNLSSVNLKNNKAIFENQDMLVSVNKRIVEVLLYENNSDTVRMLNKYFK